MTIQELIHALTEDGVDPHQELLIQTYFTDEPLPIDFVCFDNPIQITIQCQTTE